jgi:dolichol kinase
VTFSKLRSRFDDHLSRKIFHLLSGSTLAYLFVSELSRKESVFMMALGVLLTLPADILRLHWPALNRAAMRVFGPLMREGEEKSVSAQFYYVLGLLWAVLVLPKPIAIQAILTMAWMDPVAALYGLRFGKTSWKKFFVQKLRWRNSQWVGFLQNKSVEGSFAGFVAAFLAGVVAWTGPWAAYPMGQELYWLPGQYVALFSFLGASSAAIAEAWPSQWDDNVSIPFWCGLTVWAVTTILGIPMIY